MAKNSVRDFDATAANNTDIQSVDIAENCAPSGINNAIRELMADIKDVSAGTVALESPQADSMTVTGDLTVDTNTLYVDSTNNRVGVGTASPTQVLTVKTATDANLVALNDSGVRLQATNDAGTSLDTMKIAGNPLIFLGSGGAETARIDSSGNVGIGTSSPGYPLHVSGNGFGTIAKFSADDGANNPRLLIYGSSDGMHIQRTSGSGASNLMFEVGGAEGGGTEAMRIDSSGNLLVGKTTTAIGTAGSRFISNGQIQATASGNEPYFANRLSSDGVLFDFRKDGATVGSIQSSGGTNLHVQGTAAVVFTRASTNIAYIASTGFLPWLNNTYDLGSASGRWRDLYIADDIAHLDAAGNARLLYDRSSNLLGNAGTNVTCATLSKSSGSFKIDHPLESKSDTHHLVHSFVEAPQADNIYRGTVNLVDGSATINLDTEAGMTEGTFVALNREVQCFTSNESGWTAVKGSVSENTLTITAQDNTCTDTISWLVIGERKDAHMLNTDWTDDNGKVIVEPLKPVDNENMENA